MSNLGLYQTLTTVAKRVGGPGALVAGIATGGFVAGCIIGWEASKNTYFEVYKSAYMKNYLALSENNLKSTTVMDENQFKSIDVLKEEDV